MMFTHYTNVADIVKCPSLRIMLLLVCGLFLFMPAKALEVYQLVVPPATYEPDYGLGTDVYLTYDYKAQPQDQKPYLIQKKESKFNTDKGWLADPADYDRFDSEVDGKSQITDTREEFYNDCIWTSNVVVWTQMNLSKDAIQNAKTLIIDEFCIYVKDAGPDPVINLTEYAQSIVNSYNKDPMTASLGQQIVYVLIHSSVDRKHEIYQKLRAHYTDSSGNTQEVTSSTESQPYEYMHTFPAVRFNGATHNVKCVSGTDKAQEEIAAAFEGKPVSLAKDDALEHEYSIEVRLVDGNNIDPRIIDELEPLRNTVVKLNVNGVIQQRNLYFKEYNNQHSAIKLSHCDPNNFLTVNEDGSYTPIANELTIETSFTVDGLRVFGIGGPQGDDARRDRIDLTIPASHIVAPKFSPYAYRANKKTGENQFVQRVAFAAANLDMTGDQTSLAGSALACSPQNSYLPLKVDGELLLREDDPGLLYSSAFLDDIDCIAVLGESQPFHWFAEMDETNMMGVDKYDVSLAYTYLFRSGRIMGSAVGAITFDKPGEQPAAAPALYAERQDSKTHSTFTTHYTTMSLSVNDMLTSIDMAPESAVTVRTGAGWIELDGDAVVYDVAGAMVARGAGRHSLSSGIYVVCVGRHRVKTIIR